ncbi:MAG: hypothetical protein A2Z97_16210 [Bdellovibrionales bacterium GWB1_52_6]|nr:MAG: hypothetical protein A2Z97_16210 [Bdellovibrionales bacterium GWB1_52_6]OFZ05020.1 MAG: hypothetical protein A2X97_00290 [Bdellovibrionales bacterium GWA1_52_35]HCM41253.1 hypothetical protein [Bdellovibrionales bacterium]
MNHCPKLLLHFLSIFFITLTFQSAGIAGTSWLQQPSWAAGSPSDSAQERRRTLSTDTRTNISPFAPASNNLAIDVGQVFLMGDLGQYSDSIGSQIHYTYGVSDLFGFDSSLGYSEHSDGKFSMLSLLTGLRMNLSWYDKVVPYLVFGMGFYRPSYQQSTDGILSSVSPVLFGVHAGPGVDLELTKSLFFGASLTFHDAFGSTRTSANGKQLEVGGTFSSFLIHAGVTF